jgi:glycine/D-amino acid oxidase-like deaminating enzyme
MKTTLRARDLRFRNLAGNDPLDVLIVGGGMTGAPLYHELCGRGYRVALIDKGDFSSGTSQASGMLVWGEWGHCSRIHKGLACLENAGQVSAWRGNPGSNIQERFTM